MCECECEWVGGWVGGWLGVNVSGWVGGWVGGYDLLPFSTTDCKASLPVPLLWPSGEHSGSHHRRYLLIS